MALKWYNEMGNVVGLDRNRFQQIEETNRLIRRTENTLRECEQHKNVDVYQKQIIPFWKEQLKRYKARLEVLIDEHNKYG